MQLVQASPSERCGACGRALLIPLLRDVSDGDDAAEARVLARCAWCGSRNRLGASADPTAAKRAAALSFAIRGAPSPRR